MGHRASTSTNASLQPLSPTYRQMSSSSPDMTSVGYESPKPITPKPNPQTPPTRSRVPVPSSRGTPSGLKNTPTRIPRPSSRQGVGSSLPPRARSVDPERMMATNQLQDFNQGVGVTGGGAYHKSRDRYQRPTSSQSEYMTSSLVGGGRSHANGVRNPLLPRPPSTQGFMLDHFISTLPMLDFGSPDPDGKLRVSSSLSPSHPSSLLISFQFLPLFPSLPPSPLFLPPSLPPLSFSLPSLSLPPSLPSLSPSPLYLSLPPSPLFLSLLSCIV